MSCQPAQHHPPLCLFLLPGTTGDAGAVALGALKDAAKLQTLSLNVTNNSIGDDGAVALSALRAAPALKVLSLGLASNKVVAGGLWVRMCVLVFVCQGRSTGQGLGTEVGMPTHR